MDLGYAFFSGIHKFFECFLIPEQLENRALDEISSPRKPMVLYQVFVLLSANEFHQHSFSPIIIRPLHLFNTVIQQFCLFLYLGLELLVLSLVVAEVILKVLNVHCISDLQGLELAIRRIPNCLGIASLLLVQLLHVCTTST